MTDSVSDVIPASALAGAPATAAPQGNEGVSDIIPSTALGTEEAPVHAVAPKWMIEADKPIQSETDVWKGIGQAAGEALNWPGKALTGLAVRSGISNPYVAGAIGTIPDLAEDYLMGGRQAIGDIRNIATHGLAPPGVAPPAPNPYAGDVAGEQARLDAIQSRGQALGLQTPETATPAQFAETAGNNQTISENVVKKTFGLPNDAPMTPQMLNSVRKNVAAQTYGPIRAIDSVQLPPNVVGELNALPPNVLKKLPITDNLSPENTVTGKGLVDLSQGLRAMSNDYWEAYERSQLPEHKYLAQQLDSAVDGVEGAARTKLAADGNEAAADNWDQGRTTIAQTYNVQRAIKNGHLDVNNLARQQANGAPLSGDLQVLATLADRNPDAFKFTRTNVPRPGLAARATAALAPTVGAGLGGVGGTLLGGPGIGTGAGVLVGKSLGENLAKRLAPP